MRFLWNASTIEPDGHMPLKGFHSLGEFPLTSLRFAPVFVDVLTVWVGTNKGVVGLIRVTRTARSPYTGFDSTGRKRLSRESCSEQFRSLRAS